MATGSLFISYRSGDLGEGVAGLHAALAAAFGAAAVVRDQDGFIPGTDWRPQLRAGVAACDVVVCAIGPSWLRSFDGSGPAPPADFVREELLIARELGKPVLPVRLGVGFEAVRAVLPAELRWLESLQQVAWGGPSDTPALLRGVQTLGGLAPRQGSEAADGSGLRLAPTPSLGLAARRLTAALWRPTGAAAASLRPDPGNPAVALAETGLALSAMVLFTMLAHGTIGAYGIGRYIAGLAGTGLVLALGLQAMARLQGQRLPFPSVLTWGLHVASGFFLTVALWGLFIIAITSDAAKGQILGAFGNDAPPDVALATLLERLAPGTAALLLAAGVASTLHLVLGTFGALRAAAVTLGLGRRWLLWPIAPAALLAVNAALWGLTLRDDMLPAPPGERLPLKLQLLGAQDRQTAEGLQLQPLRLLWANVSVSKVGERLHVDAARVEVDNRGGEAVRLHSLHCALGVVTGGRFDWTDPLHEGEASLDTVVEPGGSLRREGVRLVIPLTAATPSGQTSVQCFVRTADGRSFPVGNGSWNLMRW